MVEKSPIAQPAKHHRVLIEALFHVLVQVQSNDNTALKKDMGVNLLLLSVTYNELTKIYLYVIHPLGTVSNAKEKRLACMSFSYCPCVIRRKIHVKTTPYTRLRLLALRP